MELLKAAPKYLSDAAAPLITLNYLLGVRVIPYPRGKLGTALSLIYLLFLLGIFGVAVKKENKFYKDIKLLKLEYVLYELLVYVNAATVAYEMVLTWLYTKRFRTCYRKMTQIDKTLRQLGSVFNYREIYFLTVSAVISWLLYVVVAVILWIVYLPDSDIAIMGWIIVAQIYAVNISFAISLEFSIFVKCLQMKFKLVNEILSEGVAVPTMEGIKLGLFAAEDYAEIMNTKQYKQVLSMKVLSQVNRQLQCRMQSSVSRKRNLVKSRAQSRLPSQLQKQFQTELLQIQSGNQIGDTHSIQRSIMIPMCLKRRYLLQTIRQVHLELCRISKSLCIGYGIQISSEIAMAIMFITGILYNLYVRFVQQKTNLYNYLMEMALGVIIGFTYVIKLILINRVCKNATYEGNKTTEIIHAIYKCCEDVDTREEVQQFGLQLTQSPVNISAFGVSLNYEVLAACLKTVTTYLVIMIQVGDSLESKIFTK